MRCPYCLDEVTNYIRDDRTNLYHCPKCRSSIPRILLDPSDKLQTTVGVVGFAGHGKTVYLTSLFSTLKRFSEYWFQYYYRSLDDYTHKIIYEQVPLFEQGKLPYSTPANFPSPAMVHYHGLPVFGDALVGYYDTAGEVFNDTALIARAGFFVAHSDVVFFILSVPDCGVERLDDEICRLLDTYIRAAVDRLDADIQNKQRIVVIFSKADLLLTKDSGIKLDERLRQWLQKGEDTWYAMEVMDKLADLSLASIWIEEWLRDDLHCPRFVNMAKDHFKEVRFTLVSALGQDHVADGQPDPLRVLDPFLWLMVFAKNRMEPERKRGFFARLFGGGKKKN